MKNLIDTMNLLVKYIINIDSKTVHLDGAEDVTGDKAFTGGVTVGGYVPECVVGKGNGYIRYSSELQICWGWATLNGAITPTNKLVTFPVAFKNKPRVITTANANVGNVFIAVG
uniref:Lower baseplate protein N-terminal domain n=1 Tax=Podoviridae sp. ct2iq11 TaxID=2827720 RepID=A0A8S5TPL2_9CAUD|nr:MAG TPA: Lower baseplate protein N-terminal domain [Podoviridae sp. ct2iq11]